MLPRTFLPALVIALLAALPLQVMASSSAPWWVLRTVRRYLPDAEVVKSSKSGHDYHITYQRDGHQGTATIEESGRLLDIEEKLAFATLPTPIQKIAAEQILPGTISSITLDVKYGILLYTFEGVVHKRHYTLVIDQKNKVISRKLGEKEYL